MIKNITEHLSADKPVIELKNVSTHIADKIIHQNLNLTIYPGEILAIVGGSGSGKTTLLRAILKLQPLTTGKIEIFGQDIYHSSSTIEEQILSNWGVMFQHGALFSSLTVLENVMFPLLERTKLDHKTIKDIAKLKIAMVGLEPEAAYKYPAELSGGMKKRAAIARAIALDPLLLFLDEPTAGLDPQGASALDELVMSLKKYLGLTIVIVTHDVDTLWRVTDRVAFLGEGKVLQVDPMDKLVQSKQQIIHDYFSDPRSRAAQHIRQEVKQEQEN